MTSDSIVAPSRASRLPRGASRALGATGLAATVGAALVLALRYAPHAADAFVARKHLNQASTDVAYWTSSDPLSGFVTYGLSLAIVFAVVAVYALLDRLASRWLAARIALPCVALLGLVYEYRHQKLTYPGPVLLGTLAIFAVLLAGHRGGGGARVTATSPRGTAAFVIACETVALAWGGWLVTVNGGLHDAWMAVFFAVSFAGWRVRTALDAKSPTALADEAVSGLPLLGAPLLGLLRAPSPWLVLLGVLFAAALRTLARRRSLRLPDWASSVAAPLAVTSIFVIPLGMRDLPTVSLKDHEGQHLGWINSALHGKMLMADASTIYGPVREYLMTAWCLVMGTTVLQVRVSFVLLNLIGLAALLGVGWKLIGRNVWLHAWYALGLLLYTPLWTMLVYKTEVSLGWADLARPGWAVLAIGGAVAALRDLDGAELTRARMLRIGAWGGATLLSVLYSQEQGLCALGAVLVAAVAHPLLTRRGVWKRRGLVAAAGTGAYAGGFVVASLLWLLAYATRGRAHLFWSTFVEGTALGASGAWGAYPFPIHADSFTSFDKLISGAGQDGGMAYEYLVGPAVYVLAGAALLARAARGRWNDRATLMLAIELFGITSFRVAMHRSDVFHLLSSTAPAVMLLAALAADAARFAPRLRARRFALPLGLALVLSLMLATFRLTFFSRLRDRINMIVLAQEVPAKGPKYVHPDVPRAGDVFVPQGMEQAAAYVRAHTKPDDPIFCRIAPMIGPEMYFLADRRDPTRYDMLAELATYSMRREARAELEADPPVLVVGSSASAGPEVDGFLTPWKTVQTFEGIPVQARP